MVRATGQRSELGREREPLLKSGHVSLLTRVMVLATIGGTACGPRRPQPQFDSSEVRPGAGFFCTNVNDTSFCDRSEAECVGFRREHKGSTCVRKDAAHCFVTYGLEKDGIRTESRCFEYASECDPHSHSHFRAMGDRVTACGEVR